MIDEKISVKAKISVFFNRFRRLFSKIDLPDVLGLIALGMIFNGLYIWKPSIAWTVVGFLLLLISGFSAKK